MNKNGRFPNNTLPPLYHGTRRYNLSESTNKDLRLGQLIDLMGLDVLRDIPLGYTDPTEGVLELRQEIGRRWGVPAEWIVITQGANFALYLVASELEAGHAIIPAPYFKQSYNTLLVHGWDVQVVQNELDDDYRLNIDAIAAALTPQTRLVSLASPQNPSGVSVPLATLERLVSIMADKAPNAYLLVDETYREAAYRTENILPSAAMLSPRVITCSSVSKAYGTPDLRVGWLTLPDATMRKAIIRAKENIVIADAGLTQRLATVLLQNGETILEQQRQNAGPMLAIVQAWQASEVHRLDWVPPDAGALCCMRLNRKRFSEADLPLFWERIVAKETFMRPGLLFGSDNRHFRLGFGHVTQDELTQGLANITAVLESL
ncbi:MAG: pyridoxal phosphate-dependent aminotransferase [Chloroflexota bacterium]